MLRNEVLVRPDVSEERIASITMVTTIGGLGMLASEPSVLTRATRRNIPEDGSLYINPVRTSQETHYVSETEPSRLMLCKI
jgi:hypothetical protein